MAPDLNSLQNYATDGYESSKASQQSRYTIPDVVLGSPTTRKIKVISIGAGVTGIMNAYYIQKLSENVEHVIYDKNKDIGGTWLENRYPGKTTAPNVVFSGLTYTGCACDIPSHAYTYPFALNVRGPRPYAPLPPLTVV